MNPLVLGLALSTAPTAAAHPPLPAYPVPYRARYVAPPVPVVPVAPIAPVPQGPMTLAQFAHCFRPTPGRHEVWLIHPVTCQPVRVCFDLPPGCPRVKVRHRSVEFDYGRREVEINFKHNGTVCVDYD